MEHMNTLDEVLIYGLSQLQETHFYKTIDIEFHDEKVIRSMFAMKLCHINQLCVSSQTPMIDLINTTNVNGPINLCLSGNQLKTYLDLTLDGINLDKHFDKFENPTGVYRTHKHNYAILDISISRQEPAPLPPAYTGLEGKLYTFVKSQNALYKGNKMIQSNVSRFLNSSTVRTFSTMLRYSL